MWGSDCDPESTKVYVLSNTTHLFAGDNDDLSGVTGKSENQTFDAANETWQVVRNTEGVVGFVGTKNKPTPVNPDELKSILAFTEIKQPTFQTSYSTGDAVKVLDGPFKDFVGSISEINQDKGQLKVLLSVFGRETPVVFDFLQVKKL